ncbi:MAG: hypothetical protein IJT21_09510 [Synergistaceae bacterium]|nr:hypothetical protein [Synergistaceae bacterium]
MNMVAESTQASKQAYIITAYKNNTELVFNTLIQMLDHPKNDIYIQMDAKNKSYVPEDTLKLVKFSKIFHAPRMKVQWGSYSQIVSILAAFEMASSNEHYEHYHVITGQDLPIKKQDEIIDFFEAHHGIEFISFQTPKILDTFLDRVKYYYLFQEYIGKGTKNRIINKLNWYSMRLQKWLNVDRTKGINFQKGSDYFSITDDLVRYLLSQRKWIRKTFKYTVIPTEECLHTLVINSDFRNKLFHRELDNSRESNMRLIDWHRGGPYTFTINDLDEIKASPCMFARKFDPAVDEQIIHEIKKLYS